MLSLVSGRGDVGVHLMLVNTVEAVFAPVAGIGSDLLGSPSTVLLNLLQHGPQLRLVRGILGNVRRQNDLYAGVHYGLSV